MEICAASIDRLASVTTEFPRKMQFGHAMLHCDYRISLDSCNGARYELRAD